MLKCFKEYLGRHRIASRKAIAGKDFCAEFISDVLVNREN